MTLPVRAEILLNNANWERNLKKSSAQLEGFGKSMKVVSNSVKALWAGVAVGAIGSVYDAIVDVTKAAADDQRSQKLLNEQMKRTWHGNDALNKSIDAQIDKMANATGVIDDKLRPALIRIAGVTKSPAKGMKMLKLSLDIAAKSGKDLNMVSMNMAKFLGGNKTALDKLVPGLSKSADKMKFLKDNYSGFAEISGRNDPFGRINVVIENFKEKLGLAFLPLANNFADWLAGPDAQAALNDIAKRVTDAFAWVNSPEGKATINEWYQKAKLLVEQLVYIIDGFAKFLGMMPGSIAQKQIDKSGGNTFIEQRTSKQFSSPTARAIVDPLGISNLMYAQMNKVTPAKNAISNNYYTINGVVSGMDVLKAIKGEASKKGLSVLKLLQQ
jgi:hypothetical protein